MSIDPELQERVNALLAPDTEAADVRETSVPLPFSPFIPVHARRAAEVASTLFAAEQAGGVAQAIAAAEDAVATESSRGLVKRALKSFVTHSAAAREVVALPAETAVDSGVPLPPGEHDRADDPSRTLPIAEQVLDWYREDPFANEHHAHWHDVWNTGGITMPDGTQLPTQPRQGELFLYMHRQMLARYDTERRIAGLPVATPFEPPYDQPIAEGYGAERYVTRPAGTSLREIQAGAGPAQLAERFASLDQAIMAGRLTVPALPELGPLDGNQLGAAIEPSDLNTGPGSDLSLDHSDTGPGPYPNIHGFGHVLTGMSADPQGGETWWGVMNYVETAIRDPFFYRWHRHIDDQGQRVEDRLGPADLSEAAAPGVHFRGDGALDVRLALSARVGDGDFDAFARDRLGGAAFDDPHGLTTDTLTTDFTRSRVASPLPAPEDQSQAVVTEESYFQTHLVHDPFGLFLRVAADADVRATVRVFLALTEQVEDRRMWIELDKFDRHLTAGVNLIGRPDALSAVIKRKGVKAPGANPPGDSTDPWCDCGWPYSLLLPSGGTAGTDFTLAVVLTDWSKDTLGQPKTCGSMSYCGARESYPDQQPMGYPFHRPFGPAGVLATLAAMDNVALRRLEIRCRREPPA